MASNQLWDVIVVGAGSAGLPLAKVGQGIADIAFQRAAAWYFQQTQLAQARGLDLSAADLRRIWPGYEDEEIPFIGVQ